ncbi:5'-nucleotidase, lipoprotein e(P4) family [Uliginosibacterium paludis]|uniref:HAD family acid phosphatase n=1 Tax=Uliginosibacterium paludis TaxID=1615952 RepID=A0ABV2CT97_9RHOO
MKASSIAAAVALSLLAGAASAEPTTRSISQVNGVYWTQFSLEHHAAAAMAYQAATAALPGLIRSKAWASLERGEASRKRPAVVLDVDETVLDNSAYDAWAVQTNQSFAPKSWAAWLALEEALAVPGAVAFTQQAARLGADVFYVTNRECTPEPTDPCPALTHTQNNLRKLGFPRANDPAAFMLRKQRPEWNSSDKSARRETIARTHHIVMLVGDDMGDFLPVDSVARLRKGEPDAAAQALLANFGKNLFMIPNPSYGSWEKALPADPAARIPLLKGPDSWAGKTEP